MYQRMMDFGSVFAGSLPIDRKFPTLAMTGEGDSKLLVPALLNELLDGGIVKTELVAELSPANFVKDGDSSSVELHPRKNINSKLEEAKEA
ncbi:hypothetical protein HO173_000002 [Letharia columbiana]|uniref:Uncharacterized protein n=1 Tax=Letharia columbiana TaxID=112416 RepID=A0A8H6G653_9LECA|nr:uncharacterized protein HO173_000002 [Letharia columbiana]KAF6241292.1 hypothetical protein HO173_000002 [Letharia columbiana]